MFNMLGEGSADRPQLGPLRRTTGAACAPAAVGALTAGVVAVAGLGATPAHERSATAADAVTFGSEDLAARLVDTPTHLFRAGVEGGGELGVRVERPVAREACEL